MAQLKEPTFKQLGSSLKLLMVRWALQMGCGFGSVGSVCSSLHRCISCK